MMLSVLKNTKRQVKFWILSNFVSPQMRNELPKIAQKYNFEFEFVRFKWPK
jgi:UDP-glucose:glycoprotein glucosyltransferase